MADTEAEIRDRKIRVKDADGNLVETGYWWFEPIQPQVFSADTFTRVLWVATPLCLYFWWLYGQWEYGLLMLACAAGLFVRYQYGHRFLQRYKEVLFCADGEIFIAPNLHLLEKRRLALHKERHHDIVSFELEQYQNSHKKTEYCVKVFFRSGNNSVVTMFHWQEHHARVVAMQLTLALQELRDAGRVSARAQSPASADPLAPSGRPRRVIE